ncbi:hypothetical_protein_-_conserved [Leishmania infantum]|uniref:Hypothetical_protein_-_conserved n=1 Tax=Leishmania infantum TaxID=5671 RepID=A0A6L0XSA2_LEIIN|nr:hypothetical_protein_-_conserved [Leishmania infantum]SUZ42931.1 hypothetical_protein_-_conserved [Leishmania infantum]
MEVERLRRVRTCADADADAEVARLEDEMRNRARDLAVSKKASERVMLRSMETPLTSGQLDALLDKDAETADMERRLRELRKKPDKNAAAIKRWRRRCRNVRRSSLTGILPRSVPSVWRQSTEAARWGHFRCATTLRTVTRRLRT